MDNVHDNLQSALEELSIIAMDIADKINSIEEIQDNLEKYLPELEQETEKYSSVISTISKKIETVSEITANVHDVVFGY